MKLDESTIATLGASLRQIDTRLMKSFGRAANKSRLWYQGGEPYFDVTVEKTAGVITWFQISLRGEIVSWQASKPRVQTGETDEMSSYGMAYATSKTIRDHVNVNWPLVAYAQAIVAQRPEDTVLTALSEILTDQLAQRSSR